MPANSIFSLKWRKVQIVVSLRFTLCNFHVVWKKVSNFDACRHCKSQS